MNDKTLTLAEAIMSMRRGEKVRHRWYDASEWVTIKDDRFLYEDGVSLTVDEFLEGKGNKGWQIDWEIIS